MTTQVLVISGSERKGSWNKLLQAVAIARLREAGCEPRPFDLRALNLPLYDGDLEAASGVPASVIALLDRFARVVGRGRSITTRPVCIAPCVTSGRVSTCRQRRTCASRLP